MRSKISTFASTAMPTVSTMPAMPGSESWNWKIDINAISINTFASRAMSAITPNSRYQTAMNSTTIT